MNTHLDHLSEEARQKGASIIKKRIEALQHRFPASSIFLVGDFNCAPGQPTYNILVDKQNFSDVWSTSLHNNGAPVSFHNWWGHWVLSPVGSVGTASFFVYWTGGYVPTHFNRYHIDWILHFPGKVESLLTPQVALVATDSQTSPSGGNVYPSGAQVYFHSFTFSLCLNFPRRSFSRDNVHAAIKKSMKKRKFH
jgi:hypothetical protein